MLRPDLYSRNVYCHKFALMANVSLGPQKPDAQIVQGDATVLALKHHEVRDFKMAAPPCKRCVTFG